VILRPATFSDLEAASSVACTTFLADVAPLYGAEGVQTFLAYAQTEEWRLRDSQGHKTWIAIEGDRVIGLAHVRNANHLSMLFVLPAHQRAGVGRALVDVVQHENPNSGLTVHSSPNAVPAYHQLGFVATGPETVISGIRFTPMRREGPSQPNQSSQPASAVVTAPSGQEP
jgi:GNAT superfamily N-acetyltransferase